jgi:hypothetical protein
VPAGQHGDLASVLLDRAIVYPKNTPSSSLPVEKGDLVIAQYGTVVQLEGSHGAGTSARQDQDHPRNSADP